MKAPKLREPVTPGEILKEEFLDPMGITAYQLCKATALSQTQVGEIIKGKRAITDETDAALSKYFGLSRGYWRRMQVSYDQRRKDHELRVIEEKVIPYAELHPVENQSELVGC
ncbi:MULTISPECIES: HigA family addiction module antitoxin [unclassified Synechococcus]|uniref:HigA family addiction module antitoxin n=1 Tax=unclassified Synechococcus TaxID=2626047 RepID=UPI0021A3639E|nr:MULTISPECIES: HigA family addiction module antitoxin [unclassified Synechococcus]MCT0212449.1 HigA family addiction module antidote protein [Synechococcus sp. CS-1326]MCT0234631.1 HigA family addiction module antidote protein [Synechococcus sp. CS-1327]